MAKNSKSFTKLALSALALGTAFTVANDAQALEAGQCGTVAEITEALRAEGQGVLFQAYRSVPTRPKNTFTSNANLTLGYNLERGVDEQSNTVCVRARYTQIQLNNSTNLLLPTWAQILPENAPYNQFLRNEQTRANAGVIFSAIALSKNANGIDVPASRITVTEGRGDQFVANRGTLLAGYSNGEYAIAANFEDITKTSNFTQMAALQDNRNSPTIALASNQPR